MERTLTLDQLDATTVEWIEQEAQRLDVSIDTIVGRLIKQGLEIERSKLEPTLQHDLTELAGTWSAEEAAEFREATADFDRIDPSLWP
jgi:hypothetical protein